MHVCAGVSLCVFVCVFVCVYLCVYICVCVFVCVYALRVVSVDTNLRFINTLIINTQRELISARNT